MASYIEGNTVRRTDAMPDYWESEREKRKKQEQQDLQRRRELRERRDIARRNQDRTLAMNRGYVIFLTMAAIVTCMTAAFYIKLQSDITIKMMRISALESTVSSLRIENDAASKRIATAVKLEDVREKAINQLGMDYPAEDQIVYYSIEHADFMTQYSEIP